MLRGGERERIILCYDDIHVKEYVVAERSYVEATCRTYNLLGWKPSLIPWVQEAARILMDGIKNRNGRRVDYVYKHPRGFIVSVHAGAVYRFTKAWKIIKATLPELGSVQWRKNERAETEWNALIPRETLKELKPTLSSKDQWAAAKTGKNKRVTAAQEDANAEQERLDQWLDDLKRMRLNDC